MLYRFTSSVRTCLLLTLAAIAGGAASIAVAADAGTISMGSATVDTGQGIGTLTVILQRTGGSTGTVIVGYSTVSGSAVGGKDYTSRSGTLTWENGNDRPKYVKIPVSNAMPFVGTKTFSFELCCAQGAPIGTPATSNVTITGDADKYAGAFSFSATAYAAVQGQGSLTVTVDRTGGASGAATVGYGTANNTATAGTDYTSTRGILSWANDDAAPKTFDIPISDATPFTGTKKFAIALASPTGAALGSVVQDVVTITGDQTATGTATLSWSAPTVNTNGTPVTNLAGYHVVYGTSASALNKSITIANPATTSYEIANLAAGTWYFAVLAFNSAGAESALSTIGSTTL